MRLPREWGALLRGKWAPAAVRIDGAFVFRQTATKQGSGTVLAFFASEHGEMWVTREGTEIARGFDTTTFPIAVDELVRRLAWCAEHPSLAPRPTSLDRPDRTEQLEEAVETAGRIDNEMAEFKAFVSARRREEERKEREAEAAAARSRRACCRP